MKKSIYAVLFFLILGTTLTHAEPLTELGFQLGALSPLNDAKTLETFGRDIYIQGHIGVIDEATGLELRGSLGRYTNTSHNPTDNGKNLVLTLTTLSASGIYHFGNRNTFFVPYLGAGVSAYMYSLDNDPYGHLDSGTKFGIHGILGFKLNISNNVYLMAEYQQAFVQPMLPILFPNATNFDNTQITLGLGIYLTPQYEPIQTKKIVQKQEDTLAIQIKDLATEIKQMKAKKIELEKQIDGFYEQTDPDVSLFSSLGAKETIEGRTLKILNPEDPSKDILSGIITAIRDRKKSLKLTVKNEKGWTLDITLHKDPISVQIGDIDHPEFNDSNIEKAFLLNANTQDPNFAQNLRKTKYLEEKLKDLEKRSQEAQNTLNELKKQQAFSNTPIEPQTTITRYDTIAPVVYPAPSYISPVPEYHFYNPIDYAPPTTIQVVTPPTQEEVNTYYKKKQQYIQNLKNR